MKRCVFALTEHGLVCPNRLPDSGSLRKDDARGASRALDRAPTVSRCASLGRLAIVNVGRIFANVGRIFACCAH